MMVAICRGREPQSVRLSEDTLLTFATVEAGEELIGTQDRFTGQLGKLEIQLRMGSAGDFTEQQYLKRLQAGVAQWSSTDIDIVKKSVAILHERMKKYCLPFPDQIHLIRVSAEVEQNAPHCRGASIVLPDSFFAKQDDATSILAHELFHVLSRFNPELRDRLYRIIHFERSNKICLPDTLQDQRLTNPDAPINEHVIQLMIDGNKTPAVPVLLIKTKEFRSGGLFANLDLKIMLLKNEEGEFVPKLVDGMPQLLHPREVPDYLNQIGRNTKYIIHPEETLADNFWMMLLGSDRIQDDWVIEEMRAVLSP